MCRGEFVLVRHMHTFRAFQPTAIAGMATLARCHACCSITNPPCMTWFYAWSLISWQTDIYDYVRSKSFQAHTNSHYTEGWAPRISFWTFSSVLYLRPLTTSETKIFFVISTDKRNETRERADWPRFVVSTAHKKMYCCDAFTTWSSVHPMSCQPHGIACKEVKKNSDLFVAVVVSLATWSDGLPFPHPWFHIMNKKWENKSWKACMLSDSSNLAWETKFGWRFERDLW